MAAATAAALFCSGALLGASDQAFPRRLDDDRGVLSLIFRIRLICVSNRSRRRKLPPVMRRNGGQRLLVGRPIVRQSYSWRVASLNSRPRSQIPSDRMSVAARVV